MSSIASIAEEFTAKLAALIKGELERRIRAGMGTPDGIRVKGRRGRPRKNPLGLAPALALPSAQKPRKKRPKQFCPVPVCKGVAAPVFGMVCSAHKGMAKAKIMKFRQERKLAKVGKKRKG